MKARLLHLHLVLFFVLITLAAMAGYASEPAPAQLARDVLIFTNGDQLTGKLMHSTGKTVTFHSDMAGDISVDWSKVKELRSQRQFVVLGKNQHWSWHSVQSVPAGSITVQDKMIQLRHADQVQVLPIKNTADVLDLDTYNREALHEANFFRRWTGAVNLGATLVQATQDTYSLNSGVALVRNTPTVSYLPPRNRTSANFASSYSRITQRQAEGAPAQPDLKTSIYHADAERDEYVSSRVYLLAETAFDHNFSQGLDLQQVYGAGVGWTVIKRSRQVLDLKATLQYEKQQFFATTPQEDTNLVGSTFSINYLHRLPLNAVFQQQAQYLPAYNHPGAYSANETNSLTFPLYKRFSLVIGTLDSYLNNPPIETYPSPPNRQNSFQFTTGISYTLK